MIYRVDFLTPINYPVEQSLDPHRTNPDPIARVYEEHNGPIHIEDGVLRFKWRDAWLGVPLARCGVIRYRGTPPAAEPPPKRGRPAKARDVGAEAK